MSSSRPERTARLAARCDFVVESSSPETARWTRSAAVPAAVVEDVAPMERERLARSEAFVGEDAHESGVGGVELGPDRLDRLGVRASIDSSRTWVSGHGWSVPHPHARLRPTELVSGGSAVSARRSHDQDAVADRAGARAAAAVESRPRRRLLTGDV